MGHIGSVPLQKILLNATSTNITTAAYVQLDDSLDHTPSFIEIFNSTGSILVLAVGAAGAEQDLSFYIFPGGNGKLGLILSRGMRLTVKAVDANATAGFLLLNFWL